MIKKVLERVGKPADLDSSELCLLRIGIGMLKPFCTARQ